MAETYPHPKNGRRPGLDPYRRAYPKPWAWALDPEHLPDLYDALEAAGLTLEQASAKPPRPRAVGGLIVTLRPGLDLRWMPFPHAGEGVR